MPYHVQQARSRGAIAAGTPITGCPPHRSVRARLRHTAPTLGTRRQHSPYTLFPRGHAGCSTESAACEVGTWFPLVPPLGSTHSAAGFPALFAGFTATMGESDFSGPCIIGFGSSPSRCGPPVRTGTDGQDGDLPVPVQGACAHARVYDLAGSSERLRWRARTSCLPPFAQCRHPGLTFYRGSMAGLCVPLSTLRTVPRGTLRMTRGQHDSLDLCCRGLAPLTPCRFLPAHAKEST